MDLELSQFRNIPISYDELASLLDGYNAPKNKVQEMERRGIVIRLKKGVYVLSEQTSHLPPIPELIANHLHGPSYVSMETALRHYGLIPEHVFAIKSMTLGRTCEFTNTIGRFSYTHTSSDYYAIGINSRQCGEAYFLIASPEKALCDLVVTTPGLQLRSMVAAREYVEEYLRFDWDALTDMEPSIFEHCAMTGKKSQSLYNLSKLIKK